MNRMALDVNEIETEVWIRRSYPIRRSRQIAAALT